MTTTNSGNTNSLKQRTRFGTRRAIGLMVRIVFLGSLTFPLCFCSGSKTPESGESRTEVKRQPAEYEPQEALWIIWPPKDHTRRHSIDSVSLRIVQHLSRQHKLVITTSHDSIRQRAMSVLGDSLSHAPGIHWKAIPTEELWIRDMGPTFVQLNDGRKAIVDFGFNAWGYGVPSDPYVQRMEAFDRLVAQQNNLPLVKSTIISEGGNRELNSQGILMLTEEVTLNRNPGLTREEIETEFKRVLGVKKFIWLSKGLLEDRHSFLGPLELGGGRKAYTVVTTNGHTDEYARFINDSTIVLADVAPEDLEDPIGRINKVRLDENYNILKKARDLNGKPFRIVRMNMPKPILVTMYPGDPVYDYLSQLNYSDGSVFPKGDPITTVAASSYLNFVITDKAILMQQLGTGEEDPNTLRDLEAMRLLKELFPEHEIIPIKSLAVNLGGGGLHCISMHEPSI